MVNKMSTQTSWQRLMRSKPVRLAQLGLGGLLMLLAPVVGIPTPGPLGIFVFAFGLALVLRNSRWARRRYLRWTRGYPRVRKAVDFGLRRKRGRRQASSAMAGRGWWRRQRLQGTDQRLGGHA
jgi:hypothetical protein